jgi:HEAT repeat protein
MKWFRSKRSRARASFENGKTALATRDVDLAISWFSDAVRLDSALALGYYGRGFAYLKKSEYARAVVDLSEAIRLDPDNPSSYYFRSLCYWGLGQHGRKAADYQKALQLDPRVEAAVHEPTEVRQTQAAALAFRAALQEMSLWEVDDAVRGLAVQALAELGPEAHLPLAELLAALRDDAAVLRLGAATALGNMGARARPAVEALTRALADGDGGVRVRAAMALWKIDRQGQHAVPVLIEALHDPKELVRWMAADCLGEIGQAARTALPALRAALTGSSSIALVRKSITLAIERIDAAAATPAGKS